MNINRFTFKKFGDLYWASFIVIITGYILLGFQGGPKSWDVIAYLNAAVIDEPFSIGVNRYTKIYLLKFFVFYSETH